MKYFFNRLRDMGIYHTFVSGFKRSDGKTWNL